MLTRNQLLKPISRLPRHWWWAFVLPGLVTLGDAFLITIQDARPNTRSTIQVVLLFAFAAPIGMAFWWKLVRPFPARTTQEI